ncbi:Glutaredoxin [Coemansia erecta]|nr:Glutaredoxin [Coemansia erecta]
MPIASKAVSELVKKLITDNSVMVFSKSYCPYCSNAKGLLTKKGIKFNSIELDIRKDGSDIQNHLIAISGQRTVPNVFVNGHHLGGNDDTVAAFQTNKFTNLLNGPTGKFAEPKRENVDKDDKEASPSPESPAAESASPAALESASPTTPNAKASI